MKDRPDGFIPKRWRSKGHWLQGHVKKTTFWNSSTSICCKNVRVSVRRRQHHSPSGKFYSDEEHPQTIDQCPCSSSPRSFARSLLAAHRNSDRLRWATVSSAMPSLAMESSWPHELGSSSGSRWVSQTEFGPKHTRKLLVTSSFLYLLVSSKNATRSTARSP